MRGRTVVVVKKVAADDILADQAKRLKVEDYDT